LEKAKIMKIKKMEKKAKKAKWKKLEEKYISSMLFGVSCTPSAHGHDSRKPRARVQCERNGIEWSADEHVQCYLRDGICVPANRK
jgi:hypothetical protein